MQDLGWIEAEGEPEGFAMADGGYLRAIVEDAAVGRTTREGISLDQILHDRPDVFAAYFREFHSPNNDHHSDAWAIRIGGETIQDYANYWYEQHGRWEGYGSRGDGTAGAPVEDAAPRFLPGIEETGRLTSDGIPLSQILTDRPDVFRAFFTEFYGRNNDHNSSAWVDRVGGATVEDYANYWYERHGKWGEYVPRAPDPVAGVDEAPPIDEDTALPPTEVEEPPPEAAAGEALDDAMLGELLVGQALVDPTDDMF